MTAAILTAAQLIFTLGAVIIAVRLACWLERAMPEFYLGNLRDDLRAEWLVVEVAHRRHRKKRYAHLALELREIRKMQLARR